MSYVGNTNTTQAFTPAIDYFSGNGSTTAFTLSRPVASVAQVQVVVNNVAQNPSSAYTVSSNTITFTSAPSSGTNNIYVYYTSPITQVTTLTQDPVITGNLNFGSTGARITGDFSNATVANRVMFQTSTVDGATQLNVVPNGTATTAGIFFRNSSSTVDGGQFIVRILSTEAQLSSTNYGAGTTLPMTFYIGGSERMRVDTSGNVGIGTTSPATQLHVSGTNAVLNITRSTKNFYLNPNYANGGSYATFESDLALATVVNGAERMRIDSSGRLLINTTTTGSYFDGPLCAYNASSLVASFKTDSATAYPLACYSTATSGNNLFITFLTEGTPTTRGYIDYNRAGTAVRYNTSSDERLKKNIVDAGSAIPLINSIKIRSFDWKETDSHVDFGVIAQELNTVAPDAVSEGTTGDDMTKTWGVDTSTLVPALVKAIQEQQALITALTARIEALENK